MRPALHHPRRPGNRRRLDQGLHHPARRTLPADAGHGQGQGTPDAGTGKRLHRAAAPPAGCGQQGAGARKPEIKTWAKRFADKQHALFLGRGRHYPIALEGALKLKEISYIHAEAYPAGELKHGPLALVDADMPVISVAPNDQLLDKLKSNLKEVQARGGELYVFADADSEITGIGRRAYPASARALWRTVADPASCTSFHRCCNCEICRITLLWSREPDVDKPSAISPNRSRWNALPGANTAMGRP
jgi:hypothetical protein